MNKEQFLELIDGLNLPKEEYYILGGGSLLLYGIREKANDVDLCVSEELFEILKTKYNINLNDKNNYGFYPINELIEVVVNKREDFEFEYIEGYPVENIRKILEFKLKRNKEKDKIDIEKINKFLENNEVINNISR